MNATRLITALAIVLGALFSPVVAATFTPFPIKAGDDAPGLPGLTLTEASPNVLNNSGDFYFETKVAGPGVDSSNDSVAYVGPTGSPSLVWREGGQVPGFPTGVNFKDPTSTSMRPWLADDGRLTFALALTGTGISSTNDTATWVYSGGTLTNLFREGNAAPGMPAGVTVANINLGQNALFPTSTGNIVHKLTLAGTGVTTANDVAVYRGTGPTDMTCIIREGDAAPGGPAGAIVDTAASTLLARGNNILAYGKMKAGYGGVTTADDSVTWITDASDNLQIALREGGAVAGAPSGVTLAGFGEWAFTANGRAVNNGAALQGTGVTTANDRAVLSGSASSQFTATAREGDAAPDLTGVTYGNSFGEGRFGNDGTILFQNTLTGTGVDGTNDYSLFMGKSDDLHLVVREGEQAPGFDAGVLIRQWGSSSFTVNNTGGFILWTTVSNGAGFTSKGLFTVDEGGDLALLLKSGNLLETDPGVFREVADFSPAYSHTQDNFNDLGQVILPLSFTDGTGATFLADLHAVPEPGTLALLAAGLISLVCYAWRKRRQVSVVGA